MSLHNQRTLKHIDLNLKKKRFRKTRRFYKEKKSPFVGTLDFIQAIKYYIL